MVNLTPIVWAKVIQFVNLWLTKNFTMEHLIVIPEHRIRLTDASIAGLLGISVEELHSLKHTPIEAYEDENGKITEFYILVSSNNNPILLSKLNMDKSNFIRFNPDDVYRLYV